MSIHPSWCTPTPTPHPTPTPPPLLPAASSARPACPSGRHSRLEGASQPVPVETTSPLASLPSQMARPLPPAAQPPLSRRPLRQPSLLLLVFFLCVAFPLSTRSASARLHMRCSSRAVVPLSECVLPVPFPPALAPTSWLLRMPFAPPEPNPPTHFRVAHQGCRYFVSAVLAHSCWPRSSPSCRRPSLATHVSFIAQLSCSAGIDYSCASLHVTPLSHSQ